MIKKFAIFFIFMVFCGQAFGQTNDPTYLRRCSYDSDGVQRSQFIILEDSFFPWGVCLGKRSGLSWEQDDWTREAMRIWNTHYKNYKINRWGSDNVVGIPDSPLFVESCKGSKHNIIYMDREDLSNEDAIAYYYPHDIWFDFMNFHGNIVMDKSKRWSRTHFINVMIHELGHALGLPHTREGVSEFMIPTGFGCGENKGKDEICKFKNQDFEAFLAPYNPPTVAENNSALKMIEIRVDRFTKRELLGAIRMY